jgi:hypothetical protein
LKGQQSVGRADANVKHKSTDQNASVFAGGLRAGLPAIVGDLDTVSAVRHPMIV